MTGAEYANLVASYVSNRFGSRTLKVYREIRIGKTIIGKNRCIDIFCVADDSQTAFAIECKFQDSQGTVDEKIPYALEDLLALPMAGCIAYAGQGFSDGVLPHARRVARTPRTVCQRPARSRRPLRRESSITSSPSTSAGGTC